jgi:DNA-binding response OmpR family regulator
LNIPVLLVDDDHAIVDLLKEILEVEGYNADVFYDGNTAVDRFKPKKYEVAILDFVLPDLKGDEVAEKLRNSDSAIGIILVTGYKSTIDTRRLRVFDAVLEKPIEPDRILRTLKEVLLKTETNETERKEPLCLIQR